MNDTVTLPIILEDTQGLDYPLNVSMCYSDIIIIEGFTKNVERLYTSKYLQTGNKITTLKWDLADGLTITNSPTVTETMSELVLLLRFIILHDEPFSFNKVTGILARGSIDPLWRKAFLKTCQVALS